MHYSDSTFLMVANYRPDVGFAWWLMESFWVDLAELSRDRGMKPLIAYPESGELPRSISSASIETIVQEFPGKGMKAVWRALLLVRKRRVRAIYFTDRPYTRLAYAALRLAGVRVIVNHDHTPGDRPPVAGMRGLVKAVWRRLPLINADRQLCVSPLIQARAALNARIPVKNIGLVQNGIEPIQCEDNENLLNRAFGVPAGAVTCITVSRAHSYKRIDFLVDVAATVVHLRRRQEIYFIFCGDGPEMARLIDRAKDARLQEHFIFAGRRNDIRSLLCASDLALHPSQGEAFSLAILEYMSAGLALLVPDIPTVCQAVVSGECGMIFPDGDVESAADMICDLADDPTKRRRLGLAASKRVRSDFSAVGMHEQLRAEISMVLHNS